MSNRLPIGLGNVPSPQALRCLAIVPAHNEAPSIGSVVDEIRAADPEIRVVFDDGSTDGTAAEAVRAGGDVVRLPFNLGIGGAMQTGYQYARDHGFDLGADRRRRPARPARAPEADRADRPGRHRHDGWNAVRRNSSYRPPFARRIGSSCCLARQPARAATGDRYDLGLPRGESQGILLFASDYPHDYPEVETTVWVFATSCRMQEVPVEMRTRSSGRSSITLFRSIYYVIKVSLALFIGLFRRYSTPGE